MVLVLACVFVCGIVCVGGSGGPVRRPPAYGPPLLLVGCSGEGNAPEEGRAHDDGNDDDGNEEEADDGSACDV